jgi:plastocyanin
MALIAGACANSSEPSGDVSTGPSSGEARRIVTRDSAFTPATLTARAGDDVTVEIANEDSIPHDFAIESLDLNTGSIEPGDVAVARFTMPEQGVEFVCTYHDGMAGTFESR